MNRRFWILFTVVAIAVMTLFAAGNAPVTAGEDLFQAAEAAAEAYTDGTWDLCFQDVAYTPTYEFNREGTVLRGQALDDGPSFPAPLTGVVANGRAYFSVAYLNNNLRFYDVSIATGQATTWGILGGSSGYFETPTATQLVPCTALGTGATEDGSQ